MDIAVRGLRKSFDGQSAALDGIDLDVASGELVALLGPSGSGKTTLLRVIAGLEIPSGGTVHFGGQNATNMTVQERRVGFVFQHYALFRHMTVFNNIAYGLKVRRRSQRPKTDEIKQRVTELLDLVQLADYERRYPAQLSGGQRQRVALARALAVEPRVLLLDEPFGALDAKVRKELRRWLRDIHDRTGHTTLFVTHDQDEALELVDRIVVLNKGRVEQVGTPEDIYDRPATPFVFSFIGDSSVLPITVRDRQAWLADCPLDLSVDGVSSHQAFLHVRPKDVVIAERPQDGLWVRALRVRRTGYGRRVEVA
jgi:sulfate transport system ATP-binding protein